MTANCHLNGILD